MDGFTACPEIRHCTTLAPMLIKKRCEKLTHAAPAMIQRAKLTHAAPAMIQRAKLTHAAPAHPCARGIPFVLNIKKGRLGVGPKISLDGKWGTD